MNATSPHADAAASDPAPTRVSRWTWALAGVALLSGASIGIALFTFNYAEGLSYLSDDPSACINCHVMQEQYDAWMHASHGRNATCNDCHVPHDSVLHKYYVKAEHGWRHSKGFTLNDFHEPIRAKESSREIVAENCMRCHLDIAEDTSVHGRSPGEGYPDLDGLVQADCLHCHARVAHGPRK